MQDQTRTFDITETISQGWIEITDKEYRQLAGFVYDNIGINLTDEKRTLLMGRLQKLLRTNGLRSFQDYYDYLLKDKTGKALSDLANHISTNHTFFYREKDHFEFFLHRALPELDERLKRNNSNDIRIWCAGCSSGEEPYTLQMLMLEHFGSRYSSLNAGILATDISEKALLIAKRGAYSTDRVSQLPDNLRKKYFRKISNTELEVVPEVKNEVTYRRFNLMNEFPFKKPFDIIFCRNVMIYFDQPTRENLTEKFYQFTSPMGYLFIGHSESLGRERNKYRFVSPALYQKV